MRVLGTGAREVTPTPRRAGFREEPAWRSQLEAEGVREGLR